jgi:hypothetical protein
MARLGHASSQAAKRYLHATRERDRAIAAALDQLGRGSPVEEAGHTETNDEILEAYRHGL